ncbi:pyridoxal kinase [Anoplophora glabripennis]|uniref:Pyridoxal kinase n=1 Tax=Anoplophora glabripennis TaxID=217634 RepID=V5IAH6_ANOGL|nr:pyridoxal kinase [Anoplophora glabripennis]
MVESPRVLSVQSHVVSGYVGNKSAVFPMQLLGFEVDAINSVQFSNHTGYKKVKGQILTEKDLSDLLEGLSENQLDHYTHLLTGYIGSVSFLNKISSVVKQLRDRNPNLIYVCDPVMGDNGKLYVPKELIPVYKNFILPLATIITPNLFEMELLTDTKITNEDDVWNAIDILHKKGCETVVISSAELAEESNLCIFASCRKDTMVNKLSMKIKKLPLSFTGTGDLFASLFLSWMYKSKGNLKEALENTIASLQAVLKRTVDSIEGKEINPRNVELKLIQSKRDIEEPSIIYRASIID